jgi:hypothetical protein
MKFLTNWTINFDKLPVYTAFKGVFNVKLNYHLLKACYESDNPVFTYNRKKLLEPIIDKINKKTHILEISHNQRYNIGRFYPDESISPICVSRHIKHTLFHFLNWIDLDMVKGHASIIYNIAKENNIQLKYFQEYLDNSSKIFDELVKYYSIDNQLLTHDNIKDIFNIAIYGGSHNTWIELMNKEDIVLKTNIEHKFVSGFISDCKKIIELVYLNNEELTNKIKGDLTDEYKLKNRTMSYWCGAIENDIIHICYKFLLKHNIIEQRGCVLEFDGICFKRNNEHTDIFLDNILIELNNKILDDTGLNVKMIWKKYKPNYVHQDIIDYINNNIKEDTYQTFEELSKIFEESHCKIKNKGFFIKHTNNKIIPMSKSMLLISYENMVYYKTEKKLNNTIVCANNFIKDWLRNNPEQRCYDDIGCYPPGIICPSNIFNTWVPFKMELVDNYQPNPEAFEKILEHIKILCDNDEAIYNYFIKWIAQMIQYPAIKSICPVLISKEGAGKGALIKLLTEMLGDEKVFESSQPNRDVWGDFNGKMANTFLVNLNELSKKDTINCEGLIKALITEPKLTINNKGSPQYEINSYHRFIITTNKEDPIKTSSDDRRKLIIRSSDEKCKNKEYFNILYSLLNDINIIKMCYEYFKNIPNIDKFNLIPLPTTNYQNDLKELSKSPIEQWLYDFTIENAEKDIIHCKSSDIYNFFIEWCKINNPDYKITSIQFAVRLKQLNIKGIEKGQHTKKGETKNFNINELKIYFNI